MSTAAALERHDDFPTQTYRALNIYRTQDSRENDVDLCNLLIDRRNLNYVRLV